MEIVKIILIVISFSLPFIALHPGSKTLNHLFSKKTRNTFLIFLSLNAIIQYFSYYSFTSSIVLRLVLFVLTGLSISGPVIYLASYFSSSALLLYIIQKPPQYVPEDFSRIENPFFFIAAILCSYILLIAVMNSRKIIKLNLDLFERTNQSKSVKLLLSILLSFKFTRLNIYNKRSIASFGIVSACALTAADNIFENIGSKNCFLLVFFSSCLLLIIFSRRRESISDITLSKYIHKGLQKVSRALERVDLVYTCYIKDKDLYFLEDSLKLYKEGMRMLSGGRSKTMIFKSQCGSNVVKLFSNCDNTSENYFRYIQSSSFQNAFPGYRNKCNVFRTDNTTKVIYPFFEGESLYTFLLKDRSRSYVDSLTSRLVNKTIDLHSSNTATNCDSNLTLSHEELENLNLNYLENKLFKNWNLISELVLEDSSINYEDFKRNALSLIDNKSLKYSNTIHGDLTFSNIVVERDSDDFVYIDPNPSSHKLLPATIVDWSKIMQSCSSQWELAITNPELLSYLHHNGSKHYSIPSPNNITYFRQSFERNLLQQGYNLGMLRLHEATHLSRALPYISQERILAKYVASRVISLICL